MLDGGDGIDGVSYQGNTGAGTGITVDLRIVGPQAVGGGFDIDTLISVENITGSNFNDVLIGDSNNNTFGGARGDDILDGGEGSDTAGYGNATGGVAVDLRIAGSQDVRGGLGLDIFISI